MKKTVYLSLGSNLGNRLENLHAAITKLSRIGTIVKVSSPYETEPMDVSNQPWFLNCAVALETELMPRQLLSATQAIEHELGRRRKNSQSKRPRTIDIDILLFGSAIINTAALTVPHADMHRRRFVLEPLAEIAPEARHPALKQTIRELRDTLPANAGAVRRVSAPPASTRPASGVTE